MSEDKRSRGRPPLPLGDAKAVFAVRLTPAERDAVNQAAKAAGKRVTEWARDALCSAAASAAKT